MMEEHGTPLWIKLAAALVVIVLAIGGTLLVLGGDDVDDGGDADGQAVAAAANGIWATSDSWTVTVIQDGGLIQPDGEGEQQRVPFVFEVVEGPAERDDPLLSGTWIVQVDQEGQEGAFADGYRLGYEETGDTMTLAWVSIGTADPAPREAASIVLGASFPLTVIYTEPPVDEEVTQAELGTATDEILPPNLDVPEPTDGGVSEGELEETAPDGPPPGVPTAP